MRATLAALLLLGCSSGAAPTAADPEPAAELPEPTPEARPAEAPLDPDSSCGRARACCEAFADAIPNVRSASACAGPGEAASAPDGDARCERMRDGWRAALEHHPRVDPPQPCQ